MKEKFLQKENVAEPKGAGNMLRLFWREEEGVGVIEIVLILVDNPFTSSTYILSY